MDVSTETRRQLKLAAAKKDVSLREYVLSALESRLTEDLKELEENGGLYLLTAVSDPVLAEIWDNERDAAYDRF